MSRMDNHVDHVGVANFVTKLDLLKGYWQIPLTQRASVISAFVNPDCFAQYSVMALRMCNAPSAFQYLVNLALSGVFCCETCLDNLILYSDTWEEHVWILDTVFCCLVQANLVISWGLLDIIEVFVRMFLM